MDESEGVGHHVVTYLAGISGTAGKVVGIQFGGSASDTTLYFNKRAEIWMKMAKWLADGGAILNEVVSGNSATLASELLAPRLVINEKKIQIEAKDQMLKRGIKSPDGADALACTFVYPDPDPYGYATASTIVTQDPLGLQTQEGPQSPFGRFRQPQGGNVIVPTQF